VGVPPLLGRIAVPSSERMTSAAPTVSPSAQTAMSAMTIKGPQRTMVRGRGGRTARLYI
jgi:hypothetical protein